jgi:phosphate transport system permease protein
MSTASSTHILPAPGSRVPDLAFKWVACIAASMIVILIVLVGFELYWGSRQSLAKFGAGFLWSSEWDPVTDKYGALPFIFGTLVSSLLALLIAVPLGVATALFLTELAPLHLRQPIVMAIEMLAAVPSVIFGL